MTDWYSKSKANHLEFIRRANLNGKLTSDEEICCFLALAQAGEAGELANLYKKIWRGDKIPLAKIESEIADVYIYLKHLCGHLGIDIDAAATKKVDEVSQRLGLPNVNG